MRLTLGKDIGIVMAKGVLHGVLTVILVMPAIVLLCDEKIQRHKHKTLLPDFSSINDFTIRHRKGFVVLTLLLFIPSLFPLILNIVEKRFFSAEYVANLHIFSIMFNAN